MVFMKESAIQKAILEYLAARHILGFRMNTGAMKGEYKGKQRFMRFGVAGMADILAFPGNNILDKIISPSDLRDAVTGLV